MVTQLIHRDFHGARIRQRPGDAYFDATAMCKANGKHFKHYLENQSTTEFLEVLSLKVGIPTDIAKLVGLKNAKLLILTDSVDNKINILHVGWVGTQWKPTVKLKTIS